MGPKEIEEKMHLDETKCCSRKRKRRRRRTLSNSDDDEEEDVSYVPESERPDTPPSKKRKIRKQWTQMVKFIDPCHNSSSKFQLVNNIDVCF